MNETSGVLRPAVEAFLLGRDLSEHHVAALRAYLRQWIAAPAWMPMDDVQDLRNRVDGLVDRDTISRWIADADALGIDPL